MLPVEICTVFCVILHLPPNLLVVALPDLFVLCIHSAVMAFRGSPLIHLTARDKK
jgi:hypothetical protein